MLLWASVTVASDDGTLLRSGKKIDAIVAAAIRQCSEGHIVEKDVFREYRLERSVSSTIASVTTELDYGNVNDNMYATTGYDDGSLVRSNGIAGLKTTGMNDSDHETGD
jgi:hypothetical protein